MLVKMTYCNSVMLSSTSRIAASYSFWCEYQHVYTGHAVPDESDSEDDSEASPSHRRNGDDSSDGGMAIPDAVESPKKERERERPKEERGPEFGKPLPIRSLTKLMKIYQSHLNLINNRTCLMTG